MADSHPYISGPGNIAKMVSHLRKSFPASVTSATVKKLGFAPNNESHVINALQFVGVIDTEGKKTQEANSTFLHHKDEEFQKAFGELVKTSYSALFDLHGDESWDLELDDLITFFRQTDETSAAIGKRQASTFKIFAGLAGHAELPETRNSKPSTKKEDKPSSTKAKLKTQKETPRVNVNNEGRSGGGDKDLALTVRIEINLPPDGSRETYDNIFKSIKENLMNG